MFSLFSRQISEKEMCRKAIDLGITISKKWSKTEEAILKENYPCNSMNKMLMLLPGRTYISIRRKAQSMGLKSQYYLNRKYSEDEINYIKTHYADTSYADMSSHLGRTEIAIKLRMWALGLRKPMEVSNYQTLYQYTRQRIIPWRNRVRESKSFICELSGSHSNIIVHHIRGFNLIFEENISNLNFPVFDSISSYSQDQLDLFVDSFIKLQEYYHQYICITESIHKQFHKIYGYGDNTESQWNEFVKEYHN